MTASLGDKAGEQGRKRLHSEEGSGNGGGEPHPSGLSNSPLSPACYFLFLLQELMVSPPWHAPSASETPLVTCESSLGQPYSCSFFPSITSLFTGNILYLKLHRVLTVTKAWPLTWQDPEAGTLLDIHPSGPSPKTWPVSLALTWHQAWSTRCLFQRNFPWICIGFFVHRRSSSRGDGEVLLQEKGPFKDWISFEDN